MVWKMWNRCRIEVDLCVLFLCWFCVGSVTSDEVVLTNVPEWFWRRLAQAIGLSNATDTTNDHNEQRRVNERLYSHAAPSSETLHRQEKGHESVEAEDTNSLPATITVWCIASFMILTSLAAIAFFVLSRRHYQKLQKVPDNQPCTAKV